MNTELIKFFKSALVKNESNSVDPISLNTLAAKHGYIIHPDCCTTDVKEFIESISWNPNSTFYKTIEDVTSKSQLELLVDQLIHYSTTYGSNFEDNTYIPNDEPLKIEYNTYTVIQPITKEELYKKCFDLICSGIALQYNTVNVLCEYILENEKSIDVDSIKNKEAQVIICRSLNKYPEDPVAFLRLLVYIAIGETLLIKSSELIDCISYRGTFVDFSIYNDNELEKLSTIFYRFKPIFLAFKKQNPLNVYPINKIRRFAKKHHKPMVTGFWEKVLSTEYPVSLIQNQALKLTDNFKIIKLLQSIKDKALMNLEESPRSLYIIRNGKVYNKEHNGKFDVMYLNGVYNILFDRLVKNIKDKSCVVKFPKYLNLTCPVSEKQFIGNIPYGSSYHLSYDNYIGIYWRNEWGTRDFDLSLITTNGQRLGWNSDFRKGDEVVYSGDMTNANPEASELFYIAKGVEDSIIKVNRFNGEEGSKYKLYFGRENIKEVSRNYMVDPNSIELEEIIESDNAEQMIAFINDNNIYFTKLTTGNNIVSSRNNVMIDIMKRKMQTYVDLKEVLLEAGFQEYNPEIHEKIDLDLTDLNKDTLIDLFTTK